MESYVRFSSSTPSPLASRANSNNGHIDSSDEPPSPIPEESVTPLQRVLLWWRGLFLPKRERYQSGYLTLIPLSDARLKPRRTKLLVISLLVLAMAAAGGVFVLVPRGVSVGTIAVHSTRMTFNATTLTYHILLVARLPLFNPNYLSAWVSGNVTVSFFDAEAGWSRLAAVQVPPRTFPQVVDLKLDASNLPRKYTQVVYTHCFNFPRKLIFFLLARFKVEYLGATHDLPSVDTYFMLDCSQAAAPPDLQHLLASSWQEAESDAELAIDAQPGLPSNALQDGAVLNGTLRGAVAPAGGASVDGREAGGHPGRGLQAGRFGGADAAEDPTQEGAAALGAAAQMQEWQRQQLWRRRLRSSEDGPTGLLWGFEAPGGAAAPG